MVKPLRQLHRSRWIYYAASILLIFTAIAIFIKHDTRSDDQSISYSKEVIDNNTINKVQVNTDSSNVDELIAKLCREKPGHCQNPDFEKLNNELTKLKIEKQKITRNIILNNDPEAAKYNEMIDKQIRQLNNRILDFLKM